MTTSRTPQVLTALAAARLFLRVYPDVTFERDSYGDVDTTLYSLDGLGLAMPAPYGDDYSEYISDVISAAALLSDLADMPSTTYIGTLAPWHRITLIRIFRSLGLFNEDLDSAMNSRVCDLVDTLGL